MEAAEQYGTASKSSDRPLEIESQPEIVLHFLTRTSSRPSLLFLSFFASKYLLWSTSFPALLASARKCWQVVGSVCIVELEPVQLEGNQLYQDEFLCPEAVAGQ